MAELPTEIIVKILSKLPVKSLLRFQCVSKSWQSLIKSHDFANMHLNQTLTSSSDRYLVVLIHLSSLHSSEINVSSNQQFLFFWELRDPLKSRESFNLVGSCNGVVCISNLSKTDVALLNPLTNSHRKLPYNDNKTVFALFGFWYDRDKDDYKVLRIDRGHGEIGDPISKNKVEVYSVKNNSWSCIEEGIQYCNYYGYFDGVVVNDCLHYLVTDEPEPEPRSESVVSIAKFDLRTHINSLMDCPNDGKFDINSSKSELLLTELGGCLCLLINNYTCFVIGDEFYLNNNIGARMLEHVDLWMMEEYGNKLSWVMLFRIRQAGDIGNFGYIRTLVLSKDRRRILLEIDGSRHGWYDLESKNVQTITPRGLPNGGFLTGTFIGTLVSVSDKFQSGNGKEETMPNKNKKKDVDKFLSAGFKLKL